MYFRIKVNTSSSLKKHTMLFRRLYTILYDVCILLCHIYEKNIIRTARLGHLHNPYYIKIDKLTGDIHHPDAGFHLNLPRYSELRNCFSGIILFSLDILTTSNTLKLFLFLLLLPEDFLYSH